MARIGWQGGKGLFQRIDGQGVNMETGIADDVGVVIQMPAGVEGVAVTDQHDGAQQKNAP